ncbi:MAG: C39 family peptidase [Ruminococcus sp.]|nr:C39 family peptidase [Ruminococcus sp.]MBP3380809.1 C39 family peptidase [Ruminococcus sp.]
MTKRKIILAASLLISSLCLSGCGHYNEVGRESYSISRERSLASATDGASDAEHRILTGVVTREEQETDEINIRDSPETYIIDDVPHIYQCDLYPTGCESVSAVSLMNFYGIDITVDEFIDNYLPRSPLPYLEDDGYLHAESPWYSFIGDPYSGNSYGCYASVIENALNSALPDGYIAEAEYGSPLEYAAEEYIANGEPVMIWATVGMKEPWQGNSWIVPNGEYFTFICPEHALLFIGYDEEFYYFSDPMAEDEIVSYYKYDCEQAYLALGAQMIRIKMCE